MATGEAMAMGAVQAVPAITLEAVATRAVVAMVGTRAVAVAAAAMAAPTATSRLHGSAWASGTTMCLTRHSSMASEFATTRSRTWAQLARVSERPVTPGAEVVRRGRELAAGPWMWIAGAGSRGPGVARRGRVLAPPSQRSARISRAVRVLESYSGMCMDFVGRATAS